MGCVRTPGNRNIWYLCSSLDISHLDDSCFHIGNIVALVPLLLRRDSSSSIFLQPVWLSSSHFLSWLRTGQASLLTLFVTNSVDDVFYFLLYFLLYFITDFSRLTRFTMSNIS